MGTAAFRANAAAAGLPANFFVANPDLLGGAFMTANVGATKYNSLQLELKRRSAQGLQFQTSYVFGYGYLLDWETFRADPFWLRDAGDPGDVSHQFKANVVYDLPFGHNRRWGANAGGALERLIGGWQLGLATRFQSGRLIDNPRIYAAYARYFVKFVEGYEGAGVPVYAVTVQNEPQNRNPNGYPGMDLPVAQEAKLIVAIGRLR